MLGFHLVPMKLLSETQSWNKSDYCKQSEMKEKERIIYIIVYI